MTWRDLHPNGWEPAFRQFSPPETFEIPPALPPSVRTGFTGMTHVPWKLTDRGAITMCGRTLLVARADGEEAACRLCRKRTAQLACG